MALEASYSVKMQGNSLLIKPRFFLIALTMLRFCKNNFFTFNLVYMKLGLYNLVNTLSQNCLKDTAIQPATTDVNINYIQPNFTDKLLNNANISKKLSAEVFNFD